MIKSSSDDLSRLWGELSIQYGSVVLCHSFIPSLGSISPNATLIIDTLLEKLGPNGTLIIPTFTYSYFKGEAYDVSLSTSMVGELGNIARLYPGAVRSLDPNFSMTAIGHDAKFLMNRDNIHTFGVGSIYDKLMKSNLYCLLLGVDFTALPLFMHLEKIFQVSYRYDKVFEGETIHREKRYKDKAIHFVRDENLVFESDRMKVGVEIDNNPACKKIFFGYGWHRLVPANIIYDMCIESYSKDKFCLITVPEGTRNGSF